MDGPLVRYTKAELLQSHNSISKVHQSRAISNDICYKEEETLLEVWIQDDPWVIPIDFVQAQQGWLRTALLKQGKPC